MVERFGVCVLSDLKKTCGEIVADSVAKYVIGSVFDGDVFCVFRSNDCEFSFVVEEMVLGDFWDWNGAWSGKGCGWLVPHRRVLWYFELWYGQLSSWTLAILDLVICTYTGFFCMVGIVQPNTNNWQIWFYRSYHLAFL